MLEFAQTECSNSDNIMNSKCENAPNVVGLVQKSCTHNAMLKNRKIEAKCNRAHKLIALARTECSQSDITNLALKAKCNAVNKISMKKSECSTSDMKDLSVKAKCLANTKAFGQNCIGDITHLNEMERKNCVSIKERA